LKSVILELRIMRHLPLQFHPNIAEVFGYGWHQSSGDQREDSGAEAAATQYQIMPYLLVPYAAHGTFRDYLRSSSSDVPHRFKEILLGDVASALSSLHSCGIVHGDIKLDNVIIFSSWDRPSATIAKLTDFGHSIVIGNDQSGEMKDSPRYAGTLP
jgi:serine/threonine protein kinase